MKFQLFALSLASLAMAQPLVIANDSEEPHAVDGNIKGSSMCRTIDNDECGKAIGFFNDDQQYLEQTHIAVGYYQYVFGLNMGMTGCKAEWNCDDPADYEKGMTGKAIKDAFQWLRDEKGMEKCGSAKLSNSCSVKVNYCSEGGCGWTYDIVNIPEDATTRPFFPCHMDNFRSCDT